jgi:hypothetical protein
MFWPKVALIVMLMYDEDGFAVGSRLTLKDSAQFDYTRHFVWELVHHYSS